MRHLRVSFERPSVIALHLLLALAANWAFPHLLIEDANEKDDAFAAGDVALAASGTVATEIALQETPVIVGYRLAALTWTLMKLMFKPRFATLFNRATGRPSISAARHSMRSAPTTLR